MLKFLVPPFIKNLDKTLVLNYPFWYIVKLHYLAYFTVLMWALSYFVGCILPIDLSSYNPQNVTGTWTFLFSVLGVVLFCVWMYYLTIYNNEDHFGKFSIWDDVKLLGILLVGLNLLMSFSYPMQLRVKTRVANVFTDTELAQQYNTLNLGYKYITSNVNDFQYCGHDLHETVDYRTLANDTDQYGQPRYLYDLNKYKNFTYFSPQNTQRYDYSFSSLFFKMEHCTESSEFKHALLNGRQIENEYALQKSANDQLNAVTSFLKVNALYESRYYSNPYTAKDYLDNYLHYEKKCVSFFPEAYNVKPEFKTSDAGPFYLMSNDVSSFIGNVYEAKFALPFILSDGYLLFAFYFSFFVALMIILFRNNRWQHFLVSVVSFILLGIILGIISLAVGSPAGWLFPTLTILTWIAAGIISIIYYFKKDKYRVVGAVATNLFYFCLPLMPFFLCLFAHEVFDWLKCFSDYSSAEGIAECEIMKRTYGDALVLAQLIGVSAFIVCAMPFYKAFFARQKALPREK